jgi:hypothetical protein
MSNSWDAELSARERIVHPLTPSTLTTKSTSEYISSLPYSSLEGDISLNEQEIMPLVAFLQITVDELFHRTASNGLLSGRLVSLAAFKEAYEGNFLSSSLTWIPESTKCTRGVSPWVLIITSESASPQNHVKIPLNFIDAMTGDFPQRGSSTKIGGGTIGDTIADLLDIHVDSCHVEHSEHSGEVTIRTKACVLSPISSCTFSSVGHVNLFPVALTHSLLKKPVSGYCGMQHGLLCRHENSMLIPVLKPSSFPVIGVWVSFCDQHCSSIQDVLSHPLVWKTASNFVETQELYSFMFVIFLNGHKFSMWCTCAVAEGHEPVEYDFMADVCINTEGIEAATENIAVVGMLKPSIECFELCNGSEHDKCDTIFPIEKSKDAIINQQNLFINEQQSQIEMLKREVCELRRMVGLLKRRDAVDNIVDVLNLGYPIIGEIERINEAIVQPVEQGAKSNREVRCSEEDDVEKWETVDDEAEGSHKVDQHIIKPIQSCLELKPSLSSFACEDDILPAKNDNSTEALIEDTGSFWNMNSFQVPYIDYEGRQSISDISIQNGKSFEESHQASLLSDSEEAESVVAIMKRYHKPLAVQNH